jgi:acyl-CoA synthetase (NDP forming)
MNAPQNPAPGATPALADDTRGVRALLKPRGIVLVGVSDDPKKMTGGPFRALQRTPFPGPVYAVSRTRDTLGDLSVRRTVAEVGDDADVALIVVPRDAVAEALEACGRRGIAAAVVITSGFADIGGDGAAHQQRLAEIARQTGIRVVGPNCTGYFSSEGHINLGTSPAFISGRYRPGSLGMITQSGSIGTTMLTLAQERGLGPSFWFSIGNEMDLKAADFLASGVENAATRALCFYLEGLHKADLFAAGARKALEAGKPIILLKVGSSEKGAASALAHTGALATDDVAFDGFCRQNAIIRVRDIDEILPVAATFDAPRRWGRGRIGVLSVSGGLSAHAVDRVDRSGLTLAELTPATVAALRDVSPLSEPANPYDFSGAAVSDPEIIRKSVQAFVDDADVDVVVVVVPFGVYLATVVPKMVAEIAATTQKLICMVRWMPADVAREPFDVLPPQGVPVFTSIRECVGALAARDRYERMRAEILAEPQPPKKAPAPLPSELAAPGLLLETEARTLLARYGLPSVAEAVAKDEGEAAAAAGRIGYPAVLKILSRDIAHKTEAGGVEVGIADEAALRAAWRRMIASVRQRHPEASVDGVLVQAMAPAGIEAIVGARHDPTFGPVVLLGLGGVLAEAFRRVAVRRAPLSRHDAQGMIDETGLGAMLASARRGRPSDRAALVEALLGVSRLMSEHGDRIAELDVNPVRVLLEGDGVLALDGLIAVREAGRDA